MLKSKTEPHKLGQKLKANSLKLDYSRCSNVQLTCYEISEFIYFTSPFTYHVSHAHFGTVKSKMIAVRNNHDVVHLIAEQHWTADGKTDKPNDEETREAETFALKNSRFRFIEDGEITI